MQNAPNKENKKKQRVTFSDTAPAAGVYMTMDEITELVKVVQENTRSKK